MTIPPARGVGWRAALAALALALSSGLAPAAEPEQVRFMSRDGATELGGLLYPPDVAGWRSFLFDSGLPAGQQGRRSALILIEDAAAVDASPASRSRLWAEFWTRRGLMVLVMAQASGPAPRTGPRSSLWESAGAARPLDAYGALDYMRSRADVLPSRIGLQSWGETAATVFAALDMDRYAEIATTRGGGFRMAVVLYPSCRGIEGSSYRPYAPIAMFIAGADPSGNAIPCQRFASTMRDRSLDFLPVMLDGAPGRFDDPARQSAPGYAAMLEKAQAAAEKFADAYMRP